MVDVVARNRIELKKHISYDISAVTLSHSRRSVFCTELNTEHKKNALNTKYGNIFHKMFHVTSDLAVLYSQADLSISSSEIKTSQLRALEMWRTLFFILMILCSVGARNVTVCEAGDPLFVGTFSPIENSIGGDHVYTNPNGKSFFQNNGFWYAIRQCLVNHRLAISQK